MPSGSDGFWIAFSHEVDVVLMVESTERVLPIFTGRLLGNV